MDEIKYTKTDLQKIIKKHRFCKPIDPSLYSVFKILLLNA